MAHSVAFCFIWSAMFSIIIGDFTFQNRFLPNSYFQSFFVKDWLQCIKACTDVSSCISYNYFSSSKCQLNKYGFQNRCQATQYLLVSQGDVFHQLRPAANNTVYVAPDPPQEQTLGCRTSPKCVPGSASLQHQDYYYFITACLKLKEEGERLNIRKELK
ncbi:PREDICTED: uncharacterized protein LOC107347472 isoform X1 [Acropora digitifera]|uniref:uncharacterized protein LOC107347472 isoform X1 n=1 Tax=Acropora digitifera TaxID=70779 RepID=UPI000779FBE7|nr:PREDICTED: uncharacterized protein LOC107347472 isoform X1 [Acropora digitifera]